MLLRKLARPMFAAWFLADGWDAARHPEPHVERARSAISSLEGLAPRAGVGEPWRRLRPPTTRQTTLVVRAHGAATVAAGVMLATGRAPRVAALALAGLTAPLVLANLPRRGETLDKTERSEQRARLLRAVTLTGGALLVGADYEGRPGVTWRVGKAREAMDKAREVRHAASS